MKGFHYLFVIGEAVITHAICHFAPMVYIGNRCLFNQWIHASKIAATFGAKKISTVKNSLKRIKVSESYNFTNNIKLCFYFQ